MNTSIDDERVLEQLMRAAQDGDTAAYERLLKSLIGLLRRTVRQRRPFLQPADIEDIVQDILLSLHAVRSTYDPGRPFMPWLMAIARNRMADAARRYVLAGRTRRATANCLKPFRLLKRRMPRRD